MLTDKTRQQQPPLPYDWPGRSPGLPDFIRGQSNEEAWRTAQVWLEGTGDVSTSSSHGMIVAGPEGSGKTLLLSHLAHARAVPVLDGPALCRSAAPLPEHHPIIIDNCHACDPQGLMRLISACLQQGRVYLIAGRGTPRDWAGEGEERLADLASRLSAIPTAMLERPDEALMSAVITARLKARQVTIPAQSAALAASRLRRSFKAVELFVDALDTAAMERQKAIDKSLVQQVLAGLPDAVL